MATAGASATTFCSAVTTPSDAAKRLIAKPSEGGPGRQREVERRQAKEPVIARDHRLTKDEAAGEAQHRSAEHDDRDQLEIVKHQRGGRKAQRLQGGDLFALGGHQPSKHDIQEECRHAEEDEGNGDRHDLLLIEFILEETV